MTRRGLPAPLWRAAYKAAWALRKGVWYAPWPHLNGALSAVWVGDQVLLVRNSYNSYFTLPGGRLNRGESYVAAAARELDEETGITIAQDRLTLARRENMHRPFGRAVVEIFETVLDELPAVVLDPVEIAEYRWETVPGSENLPLFSPVRRYLRERTAANPGEGM